MTHHTRLGRRRHEDVRDLSFRMAENLPKRVDLPVSKMWAINAEHLDQGNTGTCVGHGWRNFLRCAPIQTSAPKPSAFDIYRGAVLLDPWKENNDEANFPDADPRLDYGTTVRAGAKALAGMGRLASYLWSFSLQPTIEWLLTKGPVVVGVNWYDSMFKPDDSGLVRIGANASLEGGHCFCVRGADTKKALVRCIQSWGNDWGKKGDFFLTFKDFERLILDGGEVCTAVQSA
jgi:hypothetical protein